MHPIYFIFLKKQLCVFFLKKRKNKACNGCCCCAPSLLVLPFAGVRNASGVQQSWLGSRFPETRFLLEEIPKPTHSSFPARSTSSSLLFPKCALAFVEDRILRHLRRVSL